MKAKEATAKHRARARELRAQALSYRAIVETLQREGLTCSTYWVAQQVRGVPCPQLRGRPRLYTPEEAARRARELARLNKVKHRERINARERAERASESPIERAHRLEMQAIYRENARRRAREENNSK